MTAVTSVLAVTTVLHIAINVLANILIKAIGLTPHIVQRLEHNINIQTYYFQILCFIEWLLGFDAVNKIESILENLL